VELCKLYSDHKWKHISEVIIHGGGEIIESMDKNAAQEQAMNKVLKNFAMGSPLRRFDFYMNQEVGRKDLKKLKDAFDKE
jgi:hypothetical protein